MRLVLLSHLAQLISGTQFCFIANNPLATGSNVGLIVPSMCNGVCPTNSHPLVNKGYEIERLLKSCRSAGTLYTDCLCI